MIKRSRYQSFLTLAKLSNDRSKNFPTVMVNFFCALIINNNIYLLSFGFNSYQSISYAISPIITLWNKQNMNSNRIPRPSYWKFYEKKISFPFFLFFFCFVSSPSSQSILLILTFELRYSPAKQSMNASTFTTV